MKTNSIFKSLGIIVCIFTLAFLVVGCGCSKSDEPKATQGTSASASTAEPTQTEAVDSTSNEAEINYFDLE
ncbi:hypothetical protein [Ruminococcus sp.]|uniref:hypothetical protein n=1 Tax=Ruminococcus sp. TaxID=41978 RepID=UPI00386EC020